MSIGENIKRIRKEKGITQKALAEKLHVDPSMISQWENTKDPSKHETIVRIADALGVSYWDLIGTTAKENWEKGINQLYVVPAPDDPRGYRLYKTEKEAILQYFDLLNEAGQHEAVKYLKLLSRSKEYTRNE
jgi:transcriptional regulator with XRE-family HTH domain